MCEANAFIYKNGQEELVLEAVDLIEPEEEGSYKLVSIFGEQKIVQGKIKSINLVNNKVVFQS